MKKFVSLKKITLVAGLMLALSACSSAPADTSAADQNDPMESINRGIFNFNQVVDKYAIGPVAKGYRYITPDPLRSRIGNASDNLLEPLNMINAFLQGDFQGGMTSFWRFVLNSTIGIAGLNDVAGSAGLPYKHEDFGQTLAVWGVGDGPYVVLPLLGPSSLRDTGGRVTDWLIDPVNWAVDDTSTEIWIAVAQGLVERERLIDVIDDVNETSLDPYVTMRSMYRQHRKAQIGNNGDGPLPTSSDAND
jgi:phospholipid-binding lipoprotein MlaA